MTKHYFVVVWLVLSNATASAGGGALTGGSTEMTQILNNVQLAEQYSQQVLAYQTQLMQYAAKLKDLMAHPLGMLSPELAQLASNAAKIMQMGTDISSSMARVNANFAAVFKNPTAASFASKFNLWTNTSHDALRSAMLNAGLQREQFANDVAAVKALTAKVASSQGNLAALHSLGDLNATQLQESMKLRDLISQQQIAQNTYLAAQTAKDQARQTIADTLTKPYTEEIPQLGGDKMKIIKWSK